MVYRIMHRETSSKRKQRHLFKMPHTEAWAEAMIRPTLSPSDQTSLSRLTYYMLEKHNYTNLGFLPIFELRGTKTHAFCSEKLKASERVSEVHLLPPAFCHKGQRSTSLCGAVFSVTFPFLLPQILFHDKEVFLLLPPFLTDDIPVSNPPIHQNGCPAASKPLLCTK